MNQEIISKFDLKETDLGFGNSFVYGIKVYSYGENIIMAKCNEMGEPSENVLILNTKYLLRQRAKSKLWSSRRMKKEN